MFLFPVIVSGNSECWAHFNFFSKSWMKTYPLFNLLDVHKELKADILEVLEELIEKAQFIDGEAVRMFSTQLADYLGVRHVVTCNSGTDALTGVLVYIARYNSGYGNREYVIVPSFTFVATVEAVVNAGFKPLFVDIDPATYLMDVEQVEFLVERYADRIACILPVHLFGQCADVERLQKIACKYGIMVVEDCAQSIGASVRINGKWVKCGNASFAGCFSFYPTKNLGACGDGGAVSTNDDSLAMFLCSFYQHGQSANKYISDKIGVNSRLDAFQAAILSVKLKYLDYWNQKRIQIADWYREHLQGLEEVKLPVKGEHTQHVYHLFVIRVPAMKRDALREFLLSKGISTGVYYPEPVHRMTPYRGYGLSGVELINSEVVCKEVLALPMYPELEEEDVSYVCRCIREFFQDTG